MKIPFGQHKGKDIEEIPNRYLTWLLENDWFDKKFPEMVRPIDEELRYRQRFDIKIDE